jgi:hypothetical protein
MISNCITSPQISFNCWKHHAGFIAEQLTLVDGIKKFEELKSGLLLIGESQMDLYLGLLSPTEICEQIISGLRSQKIFSSKQYRDWLSKNGKDFQLLELKDTSVWTLRFGITQEKYIHIHPGRYSPHTVRVKAATLKTAILILGLRRAGEIKNIDTESLNKIRKKYLNEPPIKSISSANGTRRVLKYFLDNYENIFV